MLCGESGGKNIIERKLVTKVQWKIDIVPTLLRKFGTSEQKSGVHKMYAVEEGVEYGRFVEWATAPLPDYHHDPDADLPEMKSNLGPPLLGKDRPDFYSCRTGGTSDRSSEYTPTLYSERGNLLNTDLECGSENQLMWSQQDGGGGGGGGGGGDLWNQNDSGGGHKPPLGGGRKEIGGRKGRRKKNKNKNKKKGSKSKRRRGEGKKNSAVDEDSSDDYDNSEDDEFFDDIEGDFSKDDALYFRDLSLSLGVGSFEDEKRKQAKTTKKPQLPQSHHLLRSTTMATKNSKAQTSLMHVQTNVVLVIDPFDRFSHFFLTMVFSAVFWDFLDSTCFYLFFFWTKRSVVAVVVAVFLPESWESWEIRSPTKAAISFQCWQKKTAVAQYEVSCFHCLALHAPTFFPTQH